MENKVSLHKDVAFVLSSCDKCCDLWDPFFTLVKRHWSDFDYRVYLCTDSKQFSFEGVDISCPLKMAAGSTWSENLMALLEKMDEEYVLLMLDDFWLKTDVDVNRLHRYEQVMQENQDIGFICLVHQLEPSEENPISSDYPELIEYGFQTPYRVTTQTGLWRRDYLQSLLRRHESAWWFEMFGSKRSRKSFYSSYVVRDSVFSYDEGGVLFRGSYVSEYVKPFVEHEGICLKPNRRIASKDELMSEQREMPVWKKLSPGYVYNYLLSHF